MEKVDPSRRVGFRPSGQLATQLSANFNPPPEAEPGSNLEDANNHPTVLSKLQKWGDYASMGEAVKPTKFVPMKTPMSREIISNWTLGDGPKHSLTVPELLTKQAAKGREIGMILDLANHECLYEDDVPSSVEYAHVQLVAKVLPPPEAIDEVARIANEFWHRHPEKYIAIHCAYGFNRTGFVVCAYLIQCCGMSVEQAMESFAEARPPGVKHEKFINELNARYGDRRRSLDSNDSESKHCQVQQAKQDVGGNGADGNLTPTARSRQSSRQVSRQSSARSSAHGGSGVSCEQRQATDSDAAAPDGSLHVRRVSSGRGGISLAVETAAGQAEGQCGTEQLRDLQPASNLGAEADQLQSEIPIDRSTSLGLAKALCEDFSMFEGTPVRPSPLRSALSGAAAFAHAAASLSPLDSPVSPPWANAGTLQVLAQQSNQAGTTVCGAGGVVGAAVTAGSASGHSADSPDFPCSLHNSPSGNVTTEAGEPCAAASIEPSARTAGSNAAAPGGRGGGSCTRSGDAGRARCYSTSAATAAAGKQHKECHEEARVAASLPPSVGAAYTAPVRLSPLSHASQNQAGLSLPPLPRGTTVSGMCTSNPISPPSSAGVLDAHGLSISRRGNSMVLRSMSADSDNQSLGFGSQQALMQLRAEHEGALREDDQPLALLELFDADGRRSPDMLECGMSEPSECDSEEKETNAEVSQPNAGGSPPASSRAGKHQQHQGPPTRNGRSRINCRLM